ncbi:MAG TPA: tRNA (cytidine(34)-2'-O)-methyltransferase [Chthoniobacteraceae bacterium]|nr:tRNA (cytidine(34)-2'-O)-methyltransferase [Chthoniobacteraceae bacterium]
MFHVVLIEPEIPPNTGNIARLCLACDATLHLVRPLGFSIDDKALKRAGLDYWHQTRVVVWDHFDALRQAHPQGRYWFLTTKTGTAYDTVALQAGDFLVFGRETKGLPEPLLETFPDALLTIPMTTQTRSLNLATAVAIVLFEGMRQIRAATRTSLS